MPTNTKEFSNRLKAFVAEALMIRAEHADRGTRDNAKTLGVDLSADRTANSEMETARRFGAQDGAGERSPVRNRSREGRETPALQGARLENVATPGLAGWASWIRTVVMLLID